MKKRPKTITPEQRVSFSVTDNGSDIVFVNEADSKTFFGEDRNISTGILPGSKKQEYVNWGDDDHLPYVMMDLIAKDEVLAANKQFNILTCYGSGVRFIDRKTGEQSQDNEVQVFRRANNIPRFFLEQSTDMKYFYFAVAALILNKKGDKIVQIRPKEACYCRFEKADKNGKINHVFFADFDKGSFNEGEFESIELLDEYDPLTDLRVKMGLEMGADGKTEERTKARKFAVVCKFPTPGNRYYPIPYYSALFRGHWYDIKRLIGLGKKTKIKNHSGIRYIVNICDKYWDNMFKREKITLESKKIERMNEEKENINKFLSGIENSGKTLYSGYYVDPDGTEVRMVKIDVIDTTKEGGDWSDDIQEAANMLCYADNIHPNLVGATPGKGQQNNSGSDKRELFTLKQALETAYHDIMLLPLETVAAFNDWDVDIQIPMITLTTLDQHKDAQQVTVD